MSDPHERTPAGRLRARGVGIPFAGRPGPANAITDVSEVAVGYTTLIEGDDIRTGVTAILPRPVEQMATPVYAGYHSLNGNGELTGTIWIEEAGRCDGPITITNTHSCGTARDASIKWLANKTGAVGQWALPVAGETFDGHLNDINGFHITDDHVFAALNGARGGPIEEGSVGGGTGMICYGYKGGSGTSSRLVDFGGQTYTMACFVQANFGLREQLRIAGLPVGELLGDTPSDGDGTGDERGSVIAIAATDAPFLPHQLKRLARRVGLGLARTGAMSGHGSGDIFLAFSTANEAAHHDDDALAVAELVPNSRIDPFFQALIQATEEAVMNALFANESMQGYRGSVVEALPHAAVRDILTEHRIALSI